VRVIEKHVRAQRDIAWLKVSPPAATVQPSHIERQFDNRYGVAVHRFDYADPNSRIISQLRAASIGISTRRRVISNAALAESVDVEISDAGNLLPLTDGANRAVLPSLQGTAITTMK
jgi:hypothetical protein